MPSLVLMKGHPGSGKSTLASSISRTLGVPLCDKDDIRDCFQPYVAKGGAEIDWNGLSYQVLLQVVKKQLSNGISAIVDTPLARVSLYQTFKETADQFGATLVVVECVCSNLEEWKWRTDVRGAANLGTNQSHKPEGWEQLQDLLARYHGCWRWSTDGSTLIPCLLVVDTAGWPKVVEDQVLIKLAAHLSRAGSILSKQPELHVVSERYRDLKDLMAAAFPERIRGLD
ncbi:P-loop containing nucleoside triphosphate hydrolase protein [Dunaliella salina]|uniref:P-loop containing nucleoside triphosphate hydrolase protein n=1 Tax=Dunaliella salina TaxID=3046 RepID=A0ABQ7GMB2_DUNSA|nr:P-loop containing nucleoside triphosphate hydrolase protein [Dunaliella salina]|eukprot:KAF5835745.1 P-loop containing nucleoside triphosphate hydrolase protein [Dunaliella salina]